MTEAGSEPEALIERRGAAGVVMLNRPKALNALTLGMVRLLAAALDGWERDAGVTRVVLGGSGDRAFCAGGDIRRLYDLGRAGDHAEQLVFWREEYLLNRRIKTYPKPIVALIDGIVMGGGVGVSINAVHRVAGDRFMFAMPEVGIGFFPDVGAAYFLPRLPRKAGVYLALTGLSATAGDAVALGLAQTYVPSAALPPLAMALEQGVPVDEALSRFAAPAPPSALMHEIDTIESCFSLSTREAVLTALAEAEAKGSAFANAARSAMLGKSPTSEAIALRQMAEGLKLDFDDALRMDYRVVSRVCRESDFYEGVRAVIVDKDNRPKWSPPPTPKEVGRYFAPLGADELTFPGASA